MAKAHGLLIMVEGIDGSGKSNLVRPLRFAFDHRALIFERWLGSSWMYDQFLGRTPMRRQWEEAEALREIYDLKQIICYANPLNVVNRLSFLGESDWTLRELETQQKLFVDWHQQWLARGWDSIIVNTSDGIAIKDSVAHVKEWIDGLHHPNG